MHVCTYSRMTTITVSYSFPKSTCWRKILGDPNVFRVFKNVIFEISEIRDMALIMMCTDTHLITPYCIIVLAFIRV